MATIFRLPNGVTCVHEQRPGIQHAIMQVYFKTGSIHEADDQSGLTNLMQESCWGGTTTRSREQLAFEMESRGASFGSSAKLQSTSFVAHCLTRDSAAIFSLLADTILNPAFDAQEMKVAQEQIAKSIIQSAQSAPKVASTNFIEAAFTGQAAGRPVYGTVDLVRNFTPDQLRARHAAMLARPEDMVISIAGDMDLAAAEHLVKAHFSGLRSSGAPYAAVPVTFTGGDIRIANNNEQMNLNFGFEAPSSQDPKRYHVTLLKELLSGGMSSPLFREIREKRGLVYSVSAGYTAMDGSGVFLISAGTGKGNAGELMNVTFDLLADVATNGFTDEDIAIARERLIRSSRTSREETSTICASNAANIISRGRIISPAEFEANLNLVTGEDIKAACAEMLRSGKYALAGVGPQDTLPSPQEIRDMMAAKAKTIPVFAPRTGTLASAHHVAFSQAAEGPEITPKLPQHTVLKNGMIVVTTERPGSLSCGAWVGAGSSHETPALNGATHMNEHMMFKGTPSYGPGQIDAIIEGELGGGLNAYTSRDKTAYYFYNLLAKDIERVVDICGEMVFKANLDHAEFDGKTIQNADGSTTKNKGERDVVIEEIKRSNDNLSNRKWDLLFNTAYPNQAHGRPVLGTETTLRAMTVQMLAQYRDEYYAPNNVVFSAAGPVRHADFVALIDRKFGHMPAVPFAPLPTPKAQGGVAYEEMEAANTCQVALIAEAVPEYHPDKPAYDALGLILAGGDSSRLVKTLVHKKSLTSGIGAGVIGYTNAGQFGIFLSTGADKVKDALHAVYSEMRALNKNLTTAELNKVKAQLEMSVVAGLESNSDICDNYAKDALATGKPVLPAEISAQIQNLSLADIKRVAKAFLQAAPAMVAIVPQGTDRNILPTYQDVVSLRDGPRAKRSPGNAPTL